MTAGQLGNAEDIRETCVTGIVPSPRQIDPPITPIIKRTIIPPIHPIPVSPRIERSAPLGIVEPERVAEDVGPLGVG